MTENTDICCMIKVNSVYSVGNRWCKHRQMHAVQFYNTKLSRAKNSIKILISKRDITPNIQLAGLMPFAVLVMMSNYSKFQADT